MNDRIREIARQANQEAQENGWEVVVFWQDHFYTRNGKFGYPVCIQVQNHAENHVEHAYIVHWSSFKPVCEDLVEVIDKYIASLNAQPEPDHANQ